MLQVTVLSSSARRSNVAVGHLPPQPPVEKKPANSPAAEAIPITAAGANRDTGALDRERIRAVDRGSPGCSNIDAGKSAIPMPGTFARRLDLDRHRNRPGACGHRRVARGARSGETRSAIRTVWPVSKQRLAAKPTRIEYAPPR